MKNKILSAIKIFSVLILFFAFFGCTMSEEEITVSKNNSSGSAHNILYGTLGNSDENRTIMIPNANSDTYSYYIYGTNSANGTFPITSIDVNSATGKFTIQLDACYWNLTVFALPAGASAISDFSQVYTSAILIGSAAADLSNSSADASFTMSVSNLKTNGYANFDLVLSNDNGQTFWALPNDEDGAYRVKGSLRNIVTGEIIRCTDASSSSSEVGVNFTNSSGKYTGTYYPGKTLAPGTYMFQLDFFNSSMANPVFKGSWSDIIVIPAGRTLTGTFYVPNILGELPSKPQNFYATYYTNSEDSADHDGTYKLHFNWQDTANNETHFEIELAELNLSWDWSGLSSWTSPIDRPYIRSSTIYDKTYMTHPEYDIADGGSLNANNTRFTLYAKLGVQYQARIRSVNSFGASDWVNVEIATAASSFTDSDKGRLSYFGADYGDGTHSSNCIHRGRIVYYPMDGTYAPDNASLRISSPKIIYFTQMSPNSNSSSRADWWTGIELWDGAGCDNTAATILKEGTKRFRYWNNTLNFNASARVFDIDAANDGYFGDSNYSLYAEYEDDPSLINTKTYKLLSKWIWKSVDGGAPAQITTDDNARRVLTTVTKATDSSVRFNLRVPAGELPEDFTKVSMEIYNSENKPLLDTITQTFSTAGNTFILDLTDARWIPGIYELTITGEKTASGDSLYEKCFITLIVN